jgi:hypothetical protein
MIKATLRVQMLALALVFTLPSFLHAEFDVWSPEPVFINSAQVNLSTNTITVLGNDFGKQKPEIKLNAVSLVVKSFSPIAIQANLPVGLPSGSYHLVVVVGRVPPRFGTLDVTIGNTGPQGAQGPQGVQGPQGAQGVAGDVGPAGPVGPRGSTGSSGPAGPQGAQGIPVLTASQGLLVQRVWQSIR